ncbi:hypothetical protein CCYA_CCYA12G3223 [Cyanidiococcus yangmingshanensis]|nr:hypothetical protein CCYA_CCYA12G3223 [Cyanidiococcus yangmingshanensis]
MPPEIGHERVFLAWLPANLTLQQLDGLVLEAQADQLLDQDEATLFGPTLRKASSEGSDRLIVQFLKQPQRVATVRWAKLDEPPAEDVVLEHTVGLAKFWVSAECNQKDAGNRDSVESVPAVGETAQANASLRATADAPQRARSTLELLPTAQCLTQLPPEECRRWRHQRQQSAERIWPYVRELAQATNAKPATISVESGQYEAATEPDVVTTIDHRDIPASISVNVAAKSRQAGLGSAAMVFEAATHLRTKYVTKYRRKPAKYTRKILKRPQQYLREPNWIPVAGADGDEITALIAGKTDNSNSLINERPLLEPPLGRAAAPEP